MDDVVIVHKLNGKTHLFDDVANPLLVQSAFFFENVISVASTAELHH